MTYSIIRIYRPDLKKRPRVIVKATDLLSAQQHCQNPKTSTSTYFDTYTKN